MPSRLRRSHAPPSNRRFVSAITATVRPAIAVPPSSQPSPSGESTSSRRSILPAETERHPPDPPVPRTVRDRSSQPFPRISRHRISRRPPSAPGHPALHDRHTRNSTPRIPSRHPRYARFPDTHSWPTRHTPDKPAPNRTPPRTPRGRPGTKKAAPEGTASFIGSRIAGINNPATWKRRRRSSAHWRGEAPASRR